MRPIKEIRLFLFLFFTSIVCYAQDSEQEAVDSFGITVIQNATYLLKGQEIVITVLQACGSNYPMTNISIGDMNLPFYKKGIAVFKTLVGSPGFHTIPVNISFRGGNGRMRKKLYPVTYSIGQVNACIALDRMNVLYTGIDNPISVAATGSGDDKVKLIIKGGGGLIAKVGSGKYNVHVTTLTDDCSISIYVDDKMVSTSQFRVRNLPAPIGTVGGRTSGDSVSAGAFNAQEGVSAYLKDFPFELRYEVIGFTLISNNEKGEVKSINCQGARFTAEVKEFLQRYVKPGVIVTIGNLFVKSSDSRAIKLSPLIYLIK